MKRIVMFIAILCLGISLSCDVEYIEPSKTYVISKGSHNSTYKPSSLQSNTLRFDVVFDNSAIYHLDKNQSDWNKLYGFSICNKHHHTHSVRFAWRYYKDELEIGYYVYIDGERYSGKMGNATIGERQSYSITYDYDNITFDFENNTHEIETTEDYCGLGYFYMLYPYFGGNETAPHDITIKIYDKY